ALYERTAGSLRRFHGGAHRRQGIRGWLERRSSRRLLPAAIELAHRRWQPGTPAVLGPLVHRGRHQEFLIGEGCSRMALLRIPFRAMASENEIQLDADAQFARRAAAAAHADVP